MTQRFTALLITVSVFSSPALAQAVDHRAITERSLDVLERQFSAFRDTTTELEHTAENYCGGQVNEDALKASFRDAWLAWAPLDSYQFGPIEQQAAALSVNFWPDKKNFVGRGLTSLQAQTTEAQIDPATVAAGSAAAQGFPALERLLYTDTDPCPTIIGISAHLSGVAVALENAWFEPDGWADLAHNAGSENPVYLEPQEFTKALVTAANFGLDRVGDYRLGRPLGTFERSFPKRAEAWRSGLTKEIIDAQLLGVSDLIEDGFGPELHDEVSEQFLDLLQSTRDRLAAIETPIPEAVADSASRIRVEAVQTQVSQLRKIMAESLAPGLGIEIGFSAADGD